MVRAKVTCDSIDGNSVTFRTVYIALLLNRLVLAASAKGAQSATSNFPPEERITDADIDALEGQILAALTGGRPAPAQEPKET